MRFAVVGDPIEHSRSPLMHNTALFMLEELGWEIGSYRYEAWRASSDALVEVLRLASEQGLRGMNFTVPHKLAVLELADALAPSAAAIGAANTLVRSAEGWTAHNTDGEGFWAGLVELRASFEADTKGDWLRDAVVLGSGGASRAVVHAIEMHAPAACIHWVSRRPEKIESGPQRIALDYVELHAWAQTRPAQLWVNTTTVGMGGGPTEFPVELPLNSFAPGVSVVDIVYPRPADGLLHRAEAKGAWVQDGLAMLLWQGVRALELWLGKTLPEGVVEAMRAVLLDPDSSPIRHKLGDVLHVG